MLSREHVKFSRNRISTMLRGDHVLEKPETHYLCLEIFSPLLAVDPFKMCPRPPYFYRVPNISLRVSLMSEIALLSSGAVIVGVVHIRPVSPTSFL